MFRYAQSQERLQYAEVARGTRLSKPVRPGFDVLRNTCEAEVECLLGSERAKL